MHASRRLEVDSRHGKEAPLALSGSSRIIDQIQTEPRRGIPSGPYARKDSLLVRPSACRCMDSD
jgi:hypothetical protein